MAGLNTVALCFATYQKLFESGLLLTTLLSKKRIMDIHFGVDSYDYDNILLLMGDYVDSEWLIKSS